MKGVCGESKLWVKPPSTMSKGMSLSGEQNEVESPKHVQCRDLPKSAARCCQNLFRCSIMVSEHIQPMKGRAATGGQRKCYTFRIWRVIAGVEATREVPSISFWG